MQRDSVEIKASYELVEFLNKIEHEISDRILCDISNYETSMISYLSLGGSNDSISFIYSNKLQELINTHGDRFTEYVWSEKRSEMKVGKFIRLMYNDTFPLNLPKGSDKPSKPNDIESFVNLIKCEREKEENIDRFEVVKGEDIRFWYNVENYTSNRDEDDVLSCSCMRYEESGKYLQMYVENPDQINMLILKDSEGKLRARALVWHLTNMDRTFMDRIYTVNDHDIYLFKDYAKTQGWLYKSRQTYGYEHDIVDAVTNDEYTHDMFIMKCALPSYKWEYYSYLDTLCVFNKETGELSNEGKLLSKKPHLRLQDYQGGSFNDVDEVEMVYSSYYDQDIPRHDAKECIYTNTWYYNSDMVYVYNTGGTYAYKYYDGIVSSNILGKEKYFLLKECTFSDKLNTYVYNKSIINAIEIIEEKEVKIIIHKKMLKHCQMNDNGDYVYDINTINDDVDTNEVLDEESSQPSGISNLASRLQSISNTYRYEYGTYGTYGTYGSYFSHPTPINEIFDIDDDSNQESDSLTINTSIPNTYITASQDIGRCDTDELPELDRDINSDVESNVNTVSDGTVSSGDDGDRGEHGNDDPDCFGTI